MKGDFWRFGEWAITFAGDKIATWMPLLNSNVESAIASNTTISNLWDDVSKRGECGLHSVWTSHSRYERVHPHDTSWYDQGYCFWVNGTFKCEPAGEPARLVTVTVCKALFKTDFSTLRPRQMAPFRFPARLTQDFSKQKANMVIIRARMVPNGRTTSTGQNVKEWIRLRMSLIKNVVLKVINGRGLEKELWEEGIHGQILRATNIRFGRIQSVNHWSKKNGIVVWKMKRWKTEQRWWERMNGINSIKQRSLFLFIKSEKLFKKN